MPRRSHYSPCIDPRIVCALYHEARSQRKPMTRLVNELLTAALTGSVGWQTAHSNAAVTSTPQFPALLPNHAGIPRPS